ncbi:MULTISPECIES: Dps family protein [Psychrobacter]|jgi:starvation-inducible DNA-binding protein|uniref:Starvation-inducible DNA-binding protein n=1 Tax=Psychrobacter immobilis TaxID=498 RepID=A0A2V2ABI6_PSYIM|nr:MULTISPECIES: Dps family protein [Psychrobacter]MBE8609591.1 DNA starvation/stationary phase protection protein [Pseudomonas lundensis]MCG3809878.1 DNA starvation/stationary phase protection protein [Psychrobacter sp. Ps4]PWK15279.1 starvation-inducible DNA-binding protein [Psychrobacter immobilis]WLG13112.1 Dps family protein [Psychrobacter cibarius]GAF61386.1 non-specific DNA-binding protein Dps [Psychrobacter sp. JCM 18903]
MSNATNQIGLEKADMSEVIAQLNNLLSTYHVFYLNVRGYHWNVKGEHFFTLHPKFEELYTALQLQIDEIAERILTLGGTPLHAYSDFTQHTSIQEDKNVKDGNACVKGVVTGLQALITEQRKVSALAADSEDQGTADLVDAYVQEQEKLIWMYNAFLG